MTYEDEVEVKRPSVGTKVLVFGCAILAVLGSFWGIVWFIRAYVEPPRVMLPAPIKLAAGDSKPAAVVPAAKASTETAPPMAAAPVSTAQDAANGIADRWAPLSSFAPAPAASPSEPAEAPATMSAPAALPTAGADNDSAEEVAEGSVPAIAGRAPLPRRKPTQTASAAKRLDPPLPRPRPDGPAPQSVFTGVSTSDDRFQSGQ
jgi:hypothetical protein